MASSDDEDALPGFDFAAAGVDFAAKAASPPPAALEDAAAAPPASSSDDDPWPFTDEGR